MATPEGTICRQWLMRMYDGTGRAPRIAHVAMEFDSHLALVGAGLGIALVPRLGRAPLTDDVVAVGAHRRELSDLGLDLDRAIAVWELALGAELAVEPKFGWYHGDLFAENLLVRDGRLAAVLDFGGLAVGDATVDLAVAWEVLDSDGRDVFWRALDADHNARLRSMGWALAIAMMTFPYYWLTMPARCADRRSMAAAVLDEAPPPR